MLADLVNLLKPFEAVTVQLGGSYYSTFSTVIPCRYKQKTHLIEQRNSPGVHPSVSRVTGAMYNIFDDKWKAPGVHAFIASYLDPRFKTVVKQMDTYLVGPAKKLLAELIKEEQDRQREEAGKGASINDEGAACM
ncbi:Ribonuclease H-like domain [Plasmopara halstedii]|uniref:Ribonuclease H-like domain n=1 Tax=Plasmopara halstedii TaxID=4781 RepID=A0A0P1AWJ7_PLAHL|nr:Ribonuclease H-like domain [Plasmopara halstedii]CEG45039.1 Ribonuclease H-like domain [Plasmopara halstedii]|eukprot:XP_024581408.1 Ribonuclease H-like domain [Plasmopara halstedii]